MHEEANISGQGGDQGVVTKHLIPIIVSEKSVYMGDLYVDIISLNARVLTRLHRTS